MCPPTNAIVLVAVVTPRRLQRSRPQWADLLSAAPRNMRWRGGCGRRAREGVLLTTKILLLLVAVALRAAAPSAVMPLPPQCHRRQWQQQQHQRGQCRALPCWPPLQSLMPTPTAAEVGVHPPPPPLREVRPPHRRPRAAQGFKWPYEWWTPLL